MEINAFDTNNAVLRIRSIEMTNFRNIEHSKIVFPNSCINDLQDGLPSILGIYGQNGSGKTSVVMALGLLKQLISGKQVNNKYLSCIRSGFDRATITYEFSIIKDVSRDNERSDMEKRILSEIANAYNYEVTYSLDIIGVDAAEDINEKNTQTIQFENEQLSIKVVGTDDSIVLPKQVFVDTSDSVCPGKMQAFGSKSKYKLLTQGNSDLQAELFKTKAVAKNQSKSFIFSKVFIDLITNHFAASDKFSSYILIVGIFGLFNEIDHVKNPQDEDAFEQHLSTLIEMHNASFKTSYSVESTTTDDDHIEEFITNYLINTISKLITSFKLSVSIDKLKKANNSDSAFDVLDEVFTEMEERNCFKEILLINYFTDVIYTLQEAVKHKLHVVDTFSMGIVNVNKNMPLVIKRSTSSLLGRKEFTYQTIYLKMDEETLIDSNSYADISDSIEKLSQVIQKIIPDLSLSIHDNGIRYENNVEKKSIDVLASRDGMTIPLKFESDGIRRLISILSPLIGVYNDPSVILAVDEIDSGIFEYLLGEILRIFKSSGRGQLVFTSHNLRPLEVLPAKYLAFTTTNANNRYTSIAKRGNSNLRETYFRNIVLGSKNDEIYRTTDSFDIEQAFIIAGE